MIIAHADVSNLFLISISDYKYSESKSSVIIYPSTGLK